MKKLLLISLNFFFCSTQYSETLEINVNAKEHSKMNLLIGTFADNDAIINKVAQILKLDFEFSGQLNVQIRSFIQLKTKKEFFELSQQGFPIVLFINKFDKKGVEWRLYDSTSANMIKGKKVQQSNGTESSIAHAIADQVWPELMGQSGFFSSTIVACKNIPVNRKKHYEYIYAFHPIEFYSGISSAKSVVTDPTLNISPRWHPKKPILYYSKHTPYNLRLMSVNLNGRKSIVTNFDGLNMSPTFSPDGKIVLSLTKQGKTKLFKYEFDEKNKIGKYISLMNDDIHAVSPSFIDENQVVFCAIDSLNCTKIGILNINNHNIEYIVSQGYCSSPVYCSKNQKIAYCKKVYGYLQLFTYDLNNKQHSQLTFDNGDKDECSWSPCGNYLVCSIEKNNKSRIAIFSLLTNKTVYLTPESENWSEPSWSPIYEEIPFVY